MLDRSACERRVYRLAALLTGDPASAARVIESVLDAQPDLGRLDGAHMDRLTVLRTREAACGPLEADGVPPTLAAALMALPAQQREAWVFCRVYAASPRDAARAMDCSATAVQMHLDRAETAMGTGSAAGGPDAVALIRAYSMALDVPAFVRAATRRRRWRRRAVRVAAAIALLASAVAAGWLAWRAVAIINPATSQP
jgi:hypothetical protein